MSRISARTSCGTAGRPVRWRLFHVQNKRKPRRCHATTVSGLTMYTAERQPHHACASHAHSMRSTDVKRRRGRRERFTTASWCRSAMISRCSETRERTVNRTEWSSETTTVDTTAGYRRTPVTSIDAMRTVFLVGTACYDKQLRRVSVFPARLCSIASTSDRARGFF